MLRKIISVVASAALASSMMVPAAAIASATDYAFADVTEESVAAQADSAEDATADAVGQVSAVEEVEEGIEEAKEAMAANAADAAPAPSGSVADDKEAGAAQAPAKPAAKKAAPRKAAAVEPAAKIGETEYATLQEAVNAANGATITLLKDVQENISAKNKSFVLDMAGFKVSGGEKTALSLVGGTIAIENGTVTGGTLENAPRVGGLSIEGGALTLKNVTFTGCSGWAATAIQVSEGSAVLDGCVFTDNAFDPGPSSSWNVATVDFYATTAKVDNCLVAGNTANSVGGIRVRSITYSYPNKEGSLVLNNTVVKDNVATGEKDQKNYVRVGGVYAGEATTFKFFSGAIYNNKTSGGFEANDIAVESRGTAYNTYSNILSASKMEDGDASFKGYVWSDAKNSNFHKNGYSNNMIDDCLYLTAQKEETRVIATVGDQQYDDFAEAFAAASNEKPLKVVAMENGGQRAVSMGNGYIWSVKDATIDYNGHNLVSPTGWNILARSGMLTLKDTSDDHNGGVPSGNNICIYAKDVLTLSGKLGEVHLYYNHPQANFIAADSFDADVLRVSIPNDVINAINAGERQEDYVIATGSFAEDVADRVEVASLSRDFNSTSNSAMMAKVMVIGDKLILRPVNTVTIDPNVGSDENPGTTKAPVKTFARAAQLVQEAAQADNPVAYVTLNDTVVVDDEQTWNLKDIKVLRAKSFTGPQAKVANGGKLVIDGVQLVGKVGFECESGGALDVQNVKLTGDVTARCAAGGTINLAGVYKSNIELDCADGAEVNVAAPCKTLSVKKAAAAKVAVAEGFAPSRVDIELDEAFADAVANGILTEDTVLIEGYPAKLLSRAKLVDAKNLSSELHAIDGNLVLRPMGELADIYLDPVAGSDENDARTPDTAVRSFAKAAEVASGMASGKANGKRKAAAATADRPAVAINVMNTIDITGEQTMSLPGKARLIRYAEFNGNLIRVDRRATLTLEDIVIDGAGWRGCEESRSLIYSDGNINIKDGAVLQNNLHPADNGTYATRHGGAIFSTGGTIDMSGGTIRNNRAHDGGGIYAGHTTFNMSGGTIEGNVAKADIYNGSLYGSAGGGVDLGYGAVMNLSGGTIKSNSTEEPNSPYYRAGSGIYRGDGGGISLGATNRPYSDPRNSGGKKVTLNMTGGTVEGNSSVDNGGGIFVQCGTVANISGGEIVDNVSGGSNPTQFGGGGIYVNGFYGTLAPGEDALPDGELYLTNALVTDNTAAYGGGGVASCNTGTVHLGMTDASIVADNTGGYASDVFLTDLIISTNGYSMSSAYADVSDVMLGGIPYNWRYDFGTNKDAQARMERGLGASDIDGQHIPKRLLNGVGSGIFAKSSASVDDADVKASIDANVKVRIAGNSSKCHGGGIGTNGKVFMGTQDEVGFVAKKYEDGVFVPTGDAAKAFEFELKDADGNVLQTKGNNGSDVVFDSITYANEGVYTYTVNEKLPQGVSAENPKAGGYVYDTTVYTVKVTVSQQDGKYCAKARYYKGDAQVDFLKFDNKTYVEATKVVDNIVTPADGAYAFQLKDENGTVRSEVSNAGKAVAFDPVDYLGADVYVYDDGTLVGKEIADESGAMVENKVRAGEDGKSVDSTGKPVLTLAEYLDIAGEYTNFLTVTEKLPDGVTAANPRKDGVSYDTRDYIVQVSIKKADEGYTAQTKYYVEKEHENAADSADAKNSVIDRFKANPGDFDEVEAIEFNNSTYISAKKFLNGESPQDSTYKFDLKDASGKVLQTKANAGAEIVFDPIDYKEAGEYTYTVSEQVPDGVTADNPRSNGIEYDTTVYTVKVTVTEADGTFNTTVEYFNGEEQVDALVFDNKTYEEEEPDHTQLHVYKVWNDDDNAASARPDHVTVQLLKDGEAFGDAVQLDASNDWSCTFIKLDADATWSIQEIEVPAGYVSTVEQAEDRVTVTNTYEPTTEIPEEPTPLSPGTPKKVVDVTKPKSSNRVITENETPLSSVETGDDATAGILAMALLAACAAGGAALMASRLRRKEQ